MTVIIAYATPNFAFLAADSFRWDLVERRNLGPVEKLHRAGPSSAFAMGGAYIDRSRLSAGLIEARCCGEPFVDAARRLSPPLFAEARTVMRSKGVEGQQFCISWYAEVASDGCRIHRHRLPDNTLDLVNGLNLMAPDTAWLAAQSREIIKQATHQGRLALDRFAFQLIGIAATRHPTSVGYPATACILRRDGSVALRDDLDPGRWSGPQSEFNVELAS